MRVTTKLITMLAIVAMAAAACGDSADDTALTTVVERGVSPPATVLSAPEDFGESPPLGAGGTDIPNDEPYDLTFFDNYGVNPRIDTEDDALSTFAVDVDTGAYTIGRRWINDGNLPDKDSVRVEEYVNFFDQRYPAPADAPFAIHVDGGPTPFVENDRYQMVRIGLQSYEVPDAERKPAHLTFVVDISGSMDRENRLGAVRQSLEMLVNQLRLSDQVGLVVYGDRGRVILEPTPVEERETILDAIRLLQPGGSTNAEEGLVLGYRLARQAFSDAANNRVILASDGVANVGNTGADSILQTIRDEAGKGIQLVTVGFGMGNYNDVLMERLANDGDGMYAYVDTLREAERLFVHDLTGTLQTVARDAKVQVEFDPATVERYRLLGFENRAIADEDFRNDAVDAGEIGSGHSVTAVYEVKLVEGATGRLGAVTLRWQDPDTGDVRELTRDVTTDDLAAEWTATAPAFQLATTVAAYAEVLRESIWAEHLTLDQVATEARRVAELLTGDEDVAEFADLATRAAGLAA